VLNVMNLTKNLADPSLWIEELGEDFILRVKSSEE